MRERCLRTGNGGCRHRTQCAHLPCDVGTDERRASGCDPTHQPQFEGVPNGTRLSRNDASGQRGCLAVHAHPGASRSLLGFAPPRRATDTGAISASRRRARGFWHQSRPDAAAHMAATCSSRSARKCVGRDVRHDDQSRVVRTGPDAFRMDRAVAHVGRAGALGSCGTVVSGRRSLRAYAA